MKPNPFLKIVVSFLCGLLWTNAAIVGQENQIKGTTAKETTRDSSAKPSQEKPPKPIQLFNGKDLKGLRILSKAYFDEHGKIEVAKGELVIGKGMPGSGIAIDPKILKNLPRMNYEIHLQAKRIEGDDFFCGLTFPIEKSYCTLILGGWGGGAIGLSNVDTMSAIENETSEFHEFKNNQWYDIHLVVSDKTITATLNQKGWKAKKKLFEIATKEHKYNIWWEQEPARPLGITTWGTKAAFRKFELRKLTQPPKK